jgi:acyl-CoA synthetase (AMP-forming)/AMP-acid ligase II
MSDTLPSEFRPRTVPELLRSRAVAHGERSAIVARLGGRFQTLRYTDLDCNATRIASGLISSGLVTGPGGMVAWALSNHHGGEALVLYHGVLKAGAVNVPINPRLSPTEIGELLAHCGTTTLITDFASTQRLRKELPACRVVSLAELWQASTTEPADRLTGGPVSADEHDLVSILYTSGTTGLPKGVEHTHATSIAAGIAWADCFRLTADDVLQSPFPVISGAALHFNGLSSMWAGGTFVIDVPTLPASLKRIETHASTVYVAVPSIYQYWLDHPELTRHDLSSLRILDYGGSTMAPALIEQLSAKLPGVAFMQTYGFTEAGPGGTYLPEEYTRSRLGAIASRAAGRFSRFRVVNGEGKDVEPDEPGELLFRGPSVMRGYHRDPAATASVMVDGWVRSGDLVRFDDEGFLYFVDRMRELIVRGGYNIAPLEIEQALLSHPEVSEAAVFGMPHEALGETPWAAVVLRTADALSTEALIEHCAAALADFKVPKQMLLLPRLPKNAAGKVVKAGLKAYAAGRTDQDGSGPRRGENEADR